jgi:hypothetical protein
MGDSLHPEAVAAFYFRYGLATQPLHAGEHIVGNRGRAPTVPICQTCLPAPDRGLKAAA